MGCCQFPNSNSLLSPRDHLSYPSILLPERRPSRSGKTVTFDVSLTYSELNIKEDPSHDDWFETILSQNTENWTLHSVSNSIQLRYTLIENTLLVHATIQINVLIGHETILCLINNPKHRLRWDCEIEKMEVLFGDRVLDATICFHAKNRNKVQLFERTVRKYKDFYMISYLPYDDKKRESYSLIAVCATGKIEVFYREKLDELYKELERLQVWANRLNDEITIYKQNKKK
jgi:hypothetical protein